MQSKKLASARFCFFFLLFFIFFFLRSSLVKKKSFEQVNLITLHIVLLFLHLSLVQKIEFIVSVNMANRLSACRQTIESDMQHVETQSTLYL